MSLLDDSPAAFHARGVMLVTLAISALVFLSVRRPPLRQAVAASRLDSAVSTPRSAATAGAPAIPVQLEGAFEEAAVGCDVPLSLLRAVARVESNFNPRARSRVGAMGVMQLMPKTARAMGVRNPYDARENVLGGARYLRLLSDQWKGDVVLTLASYNAGPEAVRRHHGVPPYAETQRYVRRVMQHYAQYEQSRGSSLRSAQASVLVLPSEVGAH